MVADQAYATCLQLARSHYENFPVASWLMPKAARPHIAAIYAFARIADDFADEETRPATERIALLDDWQHRLDAAAAGRVVETGHTQHDAVFVALAETMRFAGAEAPALQVPGAPGLQPGGMHALLSDLLAAFRQDVTTTRYETWADVLDYCRRSANPVGRLVLMVTGQGDAFVAEKSDAVCTALQLTNFWQDLAIDWKRGRLYVPLQIVRANSADVTDLDREIMSAYWREALREVSDRTRLLFEKGRGVVDDVKGTLGWELRVTWLGGMRILDRLAQAEYDVFHHRPALSRRDVPGMFWDMVTWQTRP